VALLWFFVVASGAVAALFFIRRSFLPRRIERRLLYPLAVVERCLKDALGELCSGDEDEPLFVCPFEPEVERLARLPAEDLAAFGPRAVANHKRLCAAIQTWNAAAGQASKPGALLPIILAAHQAARELSEQIPPEGIGPARDRAEGRVLIALVGPTEPQAGWSQ